MGELTLARIQLMHEEFYVHVYTSLKSYPLERPTGDCRFFLGNIRSISALYWYTANQIVQADCIYRYHSSCNCSAPYLICICSYVSLV
jgi:hypothetical protein